MTRNLGTAGRSFDVQVTTGSTVLKTGDVVTDSDDIDALVVENGYIQVLLEPATIAEQRGAAMFKRWNGAEYQYALDPAYGDYTYFTNTPQTRPTQVTVIEATELRAELAVEWPVYSLVDASTFPDGIPYRDWDNGLNYAQGQSNPNWKYITSTRLVKTIIVKRGDEGYFLGYHSDPLVGPVASRIPTDNTETTWGERELGLGINWVRVFSSAGISRSNPEQGGHSGLGIYDPVSLGGAQQAEGPWWVGALPDQEEAASGVCTYAVLRQPLQILDYQFGADANGTIVCLNVNEARDDSNVPYRTMLFFGSFPYEVNDMAAEPTGGLRGTVARKAAALDWTGA